MIDSVKDATGLRAPAVRKAPAAVLAAVVAAVVVAMLALAPASAGGQLAAAEVGNEVPATPSDLIRKYANNSPLLASDPTDRRFVVMANRLDSPDFGCALQVSGSGGRGWLSAAPVPKLPPGADKCYAPEVVFDAKGRLYYLFVGLRGRGNEPMGVFLTTSDDRARTFSEPKRVLGPLRFMVRMALDPTGGERGRLHLVWLEAGADPPLGGFAPVPNPIMAAFSDDGGRTFSPPVQISDRDRPRAVAPALALGPGGAVHVLYYDLEDDVRDYQGLEGPRFEGTWSLVLTSSADGGRSFGPGVVVDDQVVPPERVMLIFTMAPPALAADGRGRLFAAWYDGRNGDWDVFLRTSGDAGRTWSDARRLNDDPVGNGRHQYLPRLSVAPTDRVDAIWYDRRGNVENRGNDVYYTHSTDGGATFVSNVKASSVDSDSFIGPVYDVPSALGLKEIGSRLGLLSEPTRALAAWTDTRNTGRASPAQDIFVAEIALAGVTASPPSRAPGAAPRGGGGDGGVGRWMAVAVVGVLALATVARAGRRRGRAPGAGER